MTGLKLMQEVRDKPSQIANTDETLRRYRECQTSLMAVDSGNRDAFKDEIDALTDARARMVTEQENNLRTAMVMLDKMERRLKMVTYGYYVDGKSVGEVARTERYDIRYMKRLKREADIMLDSMEV